MRSDTGRVRQTSLKSFASKLNSFHSKLTVKDNNENKKSNRLHNSSSNCSINRRRKCRIISIKYAIVMIIVITMSCLFIFQQTILTAKIGAVIHPFVKDRTQIVTSAFIPIEASQASQASHTQSFEQELQDYHLEIEKSKKTLSKQSIVVTGMIKDGEVMILGTLLQIEKLICQFDDVDIVIFENNSQDNTSFLLDVWKWRPIHCDRENMLKAQRGVTGVNGVNVRKHILHPEDDPAPTHLTREDRFVYYRNYIMDYVKNTLLPWKRKFINDSHFEYDYWMMIDLDLQGIAEAKIFEEFSIASQMLNVDVMCVNGMDWAGQYRDSFATVFDDGKWCYEDHVQCHDVIQYNRFTKVRSCFGGLAIYKFRQISESQCRYHTRDTLPEKSPHTWQWFETKKEWEDICEHIAFHDCLAANVEDFAVSISRDSYAYYSVTYYHEWYVKFMMYGTIHQ